MLVLERKLRGILPYRVIFFPTTSIVRQTTEDLGFISMARLLATDVEASRARRVVRHDISATICVDLTKDLPTLLQQMNATTRNKIRKAERLGDRITIERNGPNAANNFLELYSSLAQEKAEQILYIDRHVLERYSACSDIFVARLEGTALCGHVNLCDRDGSRVRLIYSASSRFEDHDKARLSGILNHYLHWRELQIYKGEGFRTYDFGGISRGEDPKAGGIDRFKHGFGGATVVEHNYICAGIPILGRAILRLFGTGRNE